MTDEWPPDVVERQSRDSAARTQLRARDPRLFDAFNEAFLRNDPIGINFETNLDEYEPEVGTVLPRLVAARSTDDVALILREELTHWFYPDAWMTPRLEALAIDLWALWQARPDGAATNEF